MKKILKNSKNTKRKYDRTSRLGSLCFNSQDNFQDTLYACVTYIHIRGFYKSLQSCARRETPFYPHHMTSLSCPRDQLTWILTNSNGLFLVAKKWNGHTRAASRTARCEVTIPLSFDSNFSMLWIIRARSSLYYESRPRSFVFRLQFRHSRFSCVFVFLHFTITCFFFHLFFRHLKRLRFLQHRPRQGRRRTWNRHRGSRDRRLRCRWSTEW